MAIQCVGSKLRCYFLVSRSGITTCHPRWISRVLRIVIVAIDTATAVIALPRHNAASDVDDLPYARHHPRCQAKNTGWLDSAVGSDDPRHGGP